MPLEWKIKLEWGRVIHSYGYNWSEPILTEKDTSVSYIDPDYNLEFFNEHCDKDGHIHSDGFDILTQNMNLKSVDTPNMKVTTLTLKKATLIEKESNVLDKFISHKQTN